MFGKPGVIPEGSAGRNGDRRDHSAYARRAAAAENKVGQAGGERGAKQAEEVRTQCQRADRNHDAEGLGCQQVGRIAGCVHDA